MPKTSTNKTSGTPTMSTSIAAKLGANGRTQKARANTSTHTATKTNSIGLPSSHQTLLTNQFLNTQDTAMTRERGAKAGPAQAAEQPKLIGVRQQYMTLSAP